MGQTLLSHAEGCLLKNVRKYLRVFNPKANFPLEAELLTSRSFLSLEQIFSFQSKPVLHTSLFFKQIFFSKEGASPHERKTISLILNL